MGSLCEKERRKWGKRLRTLYMYLNLITSLHLKRATKMGNETAPYALKYTVTNYCFKNCIVAKLATNSCGRSSCLLTVVLFHKRMIVIKTNETQYRTTAFNTNGRESIVSMFINDKHQ